MQKSIWVAAVVALVQLSSCKNDTEPAEPSCSTVTVTFTTNVLPIIQTSCATSTGCHASGSNKGPGPLTTYAQIAAAKTQIKSSVSSGRMPQGGTLSSDQKNTIVCWIENGAANN